ncbi:MAG TPA: hypothetical protein VGA99_10350 [bacterium]
MRTFKFKFFPFLFWPLLAHAQNSTDWLPYGHFTDRAIAESSGFVKSRQFENVFWTHNDSGDLPRLFATTDHGELIRQATIAGAKNVDWEDITTDDAGNLYIGDIGNNDNERRDLTVYVIKEPDPRKTGTVPLSKKIHFRYPDQTLFPDPQYKNFDSEALFWADGHLYLLTKHRSDRRTALYRFESLEDTQTQTLTRVGDFEVDGMVTGADASPDGAKLLVLCYEYIYLFEKPRNGDNYLAGNFKRMLIELRQSEGICFDGPSFLLTNEQRELFRIPESIFDTHDSFLPPLPKAEIPKISKYKIDGKTNEWNGLAKSAVTLTTNLLYENKNGDCVPPKLQVAWTEGGLLLSIEGWDLPKPKKKKADLLYVMLEAANNRSVKLEESSRIWKFSQSKTESTFKQTTPAANGLVPLFFLGGGQDSQTFEAFLPVEQKLSAGDRLLFNILLLPFEQCESYWATDSSTWTLANPYIWGEITLGF